MIISAALSHNKRGARIQRDAGFPYWTVGLLLKGVVEIKTQQGIFTGKQGLFMIFPPNTPYAIKFIADEEEIWCIFEPRHELRSFLQQKEIVRKISLRNTPQRPEIRRAMHQLVKWWGQNPLHPMLAENALERALLLVNEVMATRSTAPMDDRIQNAVSFIMQHYAEPLNVSAIAKNAVCSPSRFAHLFRDQMGITPIQFLEHRRIERARQLLLSTHRTIKEIAEQVGFANQFHFSTRFRKITGQSPRAFRQRPQRRWKSLPPIK